MKLDLRSLANDKRVQVGGVAAAGGAGLFVWYRKKHSAAATSSSSAASTDGSDSTTPAAYVPGSFPDTSGTDIASWLGQNEAAFTTELQQYLAGLQNTTPAPPSTPSPTPTTPQPTLPKPVVAPPHITPAPAPTTGVTPAPPAKPTPAPPKPVVKATPKPANPTVKVVAFTTKNPSPYSTLSGLVNVAKSKFGITVSVKQLQALNGLGTSTVIHPGQSIKL